MSSIIPCSLAVIFLLCFIHTSTSSSSSRFIVNHELITHHQNATFLNPPIKNIETVKEEEMRKSEVNNDMNKERKKQDEKGHKKLSSSSKKVVVINRNGRESSKDDRGGKQGSSSKSKKSGAKHRIKVVSWRVPKIQNELPQTGFNLDYAPPKVHPPTHN